MISLIMCWGATRKHTSFVRCDKGFVTVGVPYLGEIYMKRCGILTAFSVMMFVSAAMAQDEARHANTHRLLELAGTQKVMAQALPQLLNSFKKTMPNVPADFWDEFEKQADTNELVELIVPIYEAHFTDDEIKQLIAFYESPVGKKLSAETPAVSQESMMAGQKWGAALGRKIAEELRAKGYAPKTS